MIEKLGMRAIAFLIIAAIAAAALVASFHWYNKSRSAGAQARLDNEQTGALTNSAADAIGTVAASGGREAASETLTRNNEQEIRNAPGASDPVNPAVRDAGIRSLCRRAAYRDSQRCRLLEPHP